MAQQDTPAAGSGTPPDARALLAANHAGQRVSLQRAGRLHADGRTILLCPKQFVTAQEWSLALERRALLAGQTAVIGGVVCEPGSPQADAVLEFLYAPFMEGGAA